MGGAHMPFRPDTKTQWAGRYSVNVNYLQQQESTVNNGTINSVLIDVQSQDSSKGTYTVTVLPNQVIPQATGIAQAYYRCSVCDPKRILYITSLAGVSASFQAKNTDDLSIATKGIFDGDYESEDVVAILNGKFTRLVL